MRKNKVVIIIAILLLLFSYTAFALKSLGVSSSIRINMKQEEGSVAEYQTVEVMSNSSTTIFYDIDHPNLEGVTIKKTKKPFGFKHKHKVPPSREVFFLCDFTWI